MKGLLHFFCCVASADQIQCFLIHRLRINRNTINMVFSQYLQLILRNAVRSSGFHSFLTDMRQIKILFQTGQKTVHLSR